MTYCLGTDGLANRGSPTPRRTGSTREPKRRPRKGAIGHPPVPSPPPLRPSAPSPPVPPVPPPPVPLTERGRTRERLPAIDLRVTSRPVHTSKPFLFKVPTLDNQYALSAPPPSLQAPLYLTFLHFTGVCQQQMGSPLIGVPVLIMSRGVLRVAAPPPKARSWVGGVQTWISVKLLCHNVLSKTCYTSKTGLK